MSPRDDAEKLGAHEARLDAVEGLSEKTAERVSGIEKIIWGVSGAIGAISFVLGTAVTVFGDYFKEWLKHHAG